MVFDPFITHDEPELARRVREILAPSPDPDALASDLLRGCPKIGAFVGLSARATEYQIKQRLIPAWKQGRIWHSRKSEIRRRLSADRGGG